MNLVWTTVHSTMATIPTPRVCVEGRARFVSTATPPIWSCSMWPSPPTLSLMCRLCCVLLSRSLVSWTTLRKGSSKASVEVLLFNPRPFLSPLLHPSQGHFRILMKLPIPVPCLALTYMQFSPGAAGHTKCQHEGTK